MSQNDTKRTIERIPLFAHCNYKPLPTAACVFILLFAFSIYNVFKDQILNLGGCKHVMAVRRARIPCR